MSLIQLMSLPPEGSVRTFAADESLPPLPLPLLSHTLERYMESVEPFLTREALTNTQRIVKNFERGIGRELHEKLKAKATHSRNWVERWWEDKAYLENRMPLLPFCSMSGNTPLENFWTFEPGHMVQYASLYMYFIVKLWQLLRAELLVPTKSADGKTSFSMHQFRRLFNCSRLPFLKRDRLDIHFQTEKEGFCPSHVVVMCNGSIYTFDAVDSLSGTALTPLEWERQLQHIVNETCAQSGPGIGRLTCDDRDTWAKNRERLIELSGENARNLHIIDTAICVLILAPTVEPKSASEATMESMSGNYHNVWADKSLGVIFFGNGRSGGMADHTAFDGIISVTSMFYAYQSILESNGKWNGSAAIRSLEPPVLLKFIIDIGMKEELEHASIRQSANKKKVVVINETFLGFGKNFPVKYRIHPDTFIQMALQLAYYRLHKKAATCYETATTRAYYNGRTETLRSCTLEMMTWVRAMLDEKIRDTEKVKLLRKAATKHDDLMKTARENAGCDRHLFGLSCVAEENGIALPELYTDPSYFSSGGGGNFILSTSLVGYTPIGGGVAPMCLDGYGCFYNISPNRLSFTISVMKESSQTCATKFFKSLCKTFNDMQDLLIAVQHYESPQTRAHL